MGGQEDLAVPSLRRTLVERTDGVAPDAVEIGPFRPDHAGRGNSGQALLRADTTPSRHLGQAAGFQSAAQTDGSGIRQSKAAMIKRQVLHESFIAVG